MLLQSMSATAFIECIIIPYRSTVRCSVYVPTLKRCVTTPSSCSKYYPYLAPLQAFVFSYWSIYTEGESTEPPESVDDRKDNEAEYGPLCTLFQSARREDEMIQQHAKCQYRKVESRELAGWISYEDISIREMDVRSGVRMLHGP